MAKFGRKMVKRTTIAAVLASTVWLGACATTTDSTAGAGTKSAAAAAAATGVSVAEGALAGAAIAGIANAVWADQNNDGYVDGYVQNGAYYPGVPQGYDPVLRRVAGAPADVAVPGPAATVVTPAAPQVMPAATMPSGVMPATPTPTPTPTPAAAVTAKTPAPATATPPPARGERG